MKILKILLIVFVFLLVIGAVALFIFLKTFDINRYKPQILTVMNSALGRSMDFENLTLQFSLKNGLSVHLRRLTVLDDPNFQTGNFLKVDDVALGVDVFKYLKTKQIAVSRVAVHSPEIKILRRKDGQTNVQNIGKPSSPQYPSGASSQPATSVNPTPSSSNNVSIPDIFVNTIDVQNGVVSYVDQLIDPEVNIRVSNFSIHIEHFSLNNSFRFIIAAAVFNDQPNISLDGTCSINIPAQIVQLKNIKMTSDLSSVALSKLQSSVSSLKGIELPQELGGMFNASIDFLEVSPQGLSVFVVNGGLSDGRVRLKQMAVPVEDIQLKFQGSDKKLDMDEFSAQVGHGKFSASGNLEDYSGKQNLTVVMTLDRIDLSEVIEQKNQPVKIQGLVSGQWNVQAQGLDPVKLQQSLSGGGEFDVKDGRLTGINILKLILSKISLIPELGQKLEQALPERFKEKLTQNDTILTKVHMVMTAGNGSMVINPGVVQSDSFLLSSTGNIGFDQTFSLRGNLVIPEDLSASMISVVPDLQYLLDDQQQILIPVRISGKGPKLKEVLPDLRYLGEKIGKRELEKVLDKVFNKKDKNAPEGPSGNDPHQEPQPKEKRPEQQIIENILDRILK